MLEKNWLEMESSFEFRHVVKQLDLFLSTLEAAQ